jgi:fermentation-respiration switch protein FrsA (DUF1100 family)
MLEGIVRKFLYYPTVLGPHATLPDYIFGAEEVWIDSSDGNRIHGLYWPARSGRPTILFFHGNAQCVFEWALITEDLEPLECGLLLIDYPGYGKSTGRPQEEALYAAGRSALRWLIEHMNITEHRIVLFGKSLGGPVAAEVAQGRHVMGIILESTFRSIPAMIKNVVPVIPENAWLKSEQYDTASKIRTIRVPVLIVQGALDALVPLREAQALYTLANEPKQLYVVGGAGHNDVSFVAGREYGLTIRRWLDQIENS